MHQFYGIRKLEFISKFDTGVLVEAQLVIYYLLGIIGPQRFGMHANCEFMISFRTYGVSSER